MPNNCILDVALGDWVVEDKVVEVTDYLGKGEFGEVNKGLLEQVSRAAASHLRAEPPGEPEEEVQEEPEDTAPTSPSAAANLHKRKGFPVAVKSLKKESTGPILAAFLEEVTIMTHLLHPNLVRLVGIMLPSSTLLASPEFSRPYFFFHYGREL